MNKHKTKAACLCVDTTGKEAIDDPAYINARDILHKYGVEMIDGGKATDAAQAENAAARLMREAPDALLLVVLSGRSAQVIKAAGEASSVPVIIWAIGENFAFPSSALAGGALEEGGRLFRIVHGGHNNERTISDVMDALSVSHAVTRLKGSKTGLIGELFFNLVSCVYDPAVIREKFGVELQPVSYEKIRILMESAAGENELENLKKLCRSYCLKTSEKSLIPGLKLHMALKQLAEEGGMDAFAIECWSGLPEKLGLNPCLGFIEDAYVIACEGDAVLSVMLLAVSHMTGSVPFVGDVQFIDENSVMTLSHCGAPASLAAGADVILDKSPMAEEKGFCAVTCRPRLDNGPVTLIRLHGGKCDRMHIALGELIGMDRAGAFIACVRLRNGREGFIKACKGNHYIMAAGDIRGKLRLFGEWTRIDVTET